MRRALVLIAVLAVACDQSRTSSLGIATTTSVVNAGLLDAVLPQFAESRVRVHAAGSGRALAMLADGTVDLVISDAPRAEAQALSQHHDWRYAKLAYNRFVIVGPSMDPAGVRSAASAADAMKRIAASATPFISRGDESGTHERETELWALAGTHPPRDRLLVSGSGMATTLRQADAQLAYALTDEATWRQLQRELDGLSVVFANDPGLINTYAVIHRNGAPTAERFAQWLLNGHGRTLIQAFTIDAHAAFTVWPDGCPRSQPDAPLC